MKKERKELSSLKVDKYREPEKNMEDYLRMIIRKQKIIKAILYRSGIAGYTTDDVEYDSFIAIQRRASMNFFMLIIDQGEPIEPSKKDHETKVILDVPEAINTRTELIDFLKTDTKWISEGVNSPFKFWDDLFYQYEVDVTVDLLDEILLGIHFDHEVIKIEL